MSLSNDDKMKILLHIRGFAIEQIDETHAQWKINSTDILDIDISFPPELWEAKHRGKVVNWPSGLGIPATTKGAIETLAGDYNAAINVALGAANVPNDNAPLPTLLEALSAQEIEPTVTEGPEERENRADTQDSNEQSPAIRYNIENVIIKIDKMFNTVHPNEKVISNLIQN